MEQGFDIVPGPSNDTTKRRCRYVMFDLDDTLVHRAPDIVQQSNAAALQLLCSGAQELALLSEQLAEVYRETTQGTGVLVPKRSSSHACCNGSDGPMLRIDCSMPISRAIFRW